MTSAKPRKFPYVQGVPKSFVQLFRPFMDRILHHFCAIFQSNFFTDLLILDRFQIFFWLLGTFCVTLYSKYFECLPFPPYLRFPTCIAVHPLRPVCDKNPQWLDRTFPQKFLERIGQSARICQLRRIPKRQFCTPA